MTSFSRFSLGGSFQPFDEFVLAQGFDFIDGFERTDSDPAFPEGLLVRAEFNDTGHTTWDATITTTTIIWSQDQAVVDALIGRAPSMVRLWWCIGEGETPDTKLPWLEAQVTIKPALVAS